MENKNAKGHVLALITIIIWGTTFISTKVLLTDFQPVEILFFRFVLGFLALTIAYPKLLKGTNVRQEIMFALAGLCGICLYYLLENIALTYTLASNVGVVVSTTPFFTAILARFFTKKKERLSRNFIIGFVVAMIGICLISFAGSTVEINPIGDILAILAALVWAIYSLLTKKISTYGYNTIQTTRRVFLYGIIFMLPAIFIFDFSWDLTRFSNPVYLYNLLFLGLGASALCFVTWNYAVKVLGAVKTSVYIYIVPVVTVITAAIILNERLTPVAICGAVLALAGLFISENKLTIGKRGHKKNAKGNSR